jgi:hypothetical protein
LVRIKLFRGLAHSASDKFVSARYRLRAHSLELSKAREQASQLELGHWVTTK